MNQYQGVESGQGILKDNYKGGIVSQTNDSSPMLAAIRKKRKQAK